MFLNKKKAIFLISAVSLLFILTFNQIKAQELKVVDGDTIHLNGEKIRFTGIDTPELKQTCIKDGVKDPCGVTAKEILIDRIGDSKVECISEGKDQYKRTLAECFVNNEQLLPVVYMIGVLLLVLPAFLQSNSKLKQFLTNLTVWIVIILIILTIIYLFNLKK